MLTFARKRRPAGAWAAALVGLSLSFGGAAQAAGPDPEAIEQLRRATTHLVGLKSFSLRAQSVLEVVLVSGQKIELDSESTLTIERPNRMVATRRGESGDQSLYFDGELLTFYSAEQRYYASARPPATLEGMLDFARDELDIVAPAADLLYADVFESLTSDMTAGFVVSKTVWLDERSCTHLAFRKPGVDVQVWVTNGEKPLLVKLVLTTTDMPASPRFSVVLSDWDLAPKIDAKTFQFSPPEGAQRIEFLRASAAPAKP